MKILQILLHSFWELDTNSSLKFSLPIQTNLKIIFRIEKILIKEAKSIINHQSKISPQKDKTYNLPFKVNQMIKLGCPKENYVYTIK